MKFVFGKAHKLVEASWNLLIDDTSRELAGILIQSSFERIISDPYIKAESASTYCGIMMIASSKVQISLDLGERDGWYININGGCCQNLFSIEKEIELDHFPEKEDRIKVSKWPNGKHWYATVDFESVTDELGRNKWNTQGEAFKEAEKFFKNKSVKK